MNPGEPIYTTPGVPAQLTVATAMDGDSGEWMVIVRVADYVWAITPEVAAQLSNSLMVAAALAQQSTREAGRPT